MMGVINPVVHGEDGRRKWALGVMAYGGGLLVSGTVLGAMLAAPVALLPVTTDPAIVVAAIAVLSLAYGLHELRLLRLPAPQRRRQVPHEWRRVYGFPLLPFLYGLGLGANFLTYVSTSLLYVVTAGVVLLGDPLIGALVFGAVALGRWLVLLPVGMKEDRSWPGRVTRAFLGVENQVRVVTGVVLLLLGAWFVVPWASAL